MISFEIPPFIQNQLGMIRMVAEQAMRPYSRELDENEHARPEAFVQMTWPFTQEMVKRSLKPLMEQANGTNGSTKPKKEGPDYGMVNFIMMIEQLSWGDAGQYLCLPRSAVGGHPRDVGQNVVLGDAPVAPRARYPAQIHAMLGGDAADDRADAAGVGNDGRQPTADRHQRGVGSGRIAVCGLWSVVYRGTGDFAFGSGRRSAVGGRFFPRFANDGHHCAHGNRLPLADQQAQDGSGGLGCRLGRHLVGFYFGDRRVPLHAVALAHQPAGQRAFDDAFAHFGQSDLSAHGCSPRKGGGAGGQESRGEKESPLLPCTPAPLRVNSRRRGKEDMAKERRETAPGWLRSSCRRARQRHPRHWAWRSTPRRSHRPGGGVGR